MKLKRVYSKIDDIEEVFRPLYEERDGKQVLAAEIEGLVPANKLDEFRTQNIKDREKFEAELKKFEGVDPERYKELSQRASELDEHKLIKKGEVDTVVNSRVEAMTKPLREEVAKKEDRIGQLRAKLQKATIENAILGEASPFMKKTAGPDIVRRGLDIFRFDDNDNIIAVQEDGKTPRYNTSTGEPYTFSDFVNDLRKGDGAHLFEENAGHGSDIPRGAAGTFTGPNPWDDKTFNRTEQGKIITANYPLACQLAKRAGKPEPKKPVGK